MQDQEPSPTILEPLRLYQESATIHGITMLSAPQLYHCRRLIWTVLVIGMAILLAWTLYKQVSQLNKRPIKTITESPLYHELPFPAVTICNINQYVKDRVPDNEMIKNVIYYKSEYAKLTKAHSRLSNMDNLTDVSGEELLQMSLYAAPRLEELLVACAWSFHTYDCKDLFKPINTSYGQCFVFNKDKNNIQKTTMSGPREGLRLMIDIQNKRSYYSQKIHAGIRVLVHQQDEEPFPKEKGWYIRPGVAVELALTRIDHKRLPHPYKAFSNSYCEDREANGYVNKLTRYAHYSYANCQAQCLLDFLNTTCGCRGYHEPVSVLSAGNSALCSAKQHILCYSPALNMFSRSHLEACACVEECNTVSYSAELMYADFSSIFIEEMASTHNLSYAGGFRTSAIEVDIFYKTLHVDVIEQQPEVSLVTILATLGGEMGLFLGASLLSFAEILELLFLFVYRGVKSCRCHFIDAKKVESSQTARNEPDLPRKYSFDDWTAKKKSGVHVASVKDPLHF
ncbi:acid-sensing ion channel 4 [Plakobranchus ocellatus]|uniref:Acid-sensing ion channel 4 n=1 Tax=Plakobranchus ocellatus TaxID=259542 RepID=A0AAV4AJ27_9GAST|nr:acid-sensing ion channel 4 [Plakobranchus ocellatus]